MDTLVDWYHLHAQRLATTASIILVVIIALGLADGLLFVVDHLDQETATPAQTTTTTTTRAAPDQATAITALNLFGQVQRQAAPVQVDAPQTRLNLELQGVFIATLADQSSAIVAERGKAGELFRIGDRLPGNAVLEAVLNDHILLKRGGRIEKLMFSDSAIRQQFTPDADDATADAPKASIRQRLEAVRTQIAERQQPPMTRQTQPGANLRNFVNDYRERIEADPQGVLDELGVSVVAEGASSGYRLGNELPSQQMLQAGLQEGDLILSVNGTPVGDVSSDLALIDQAMAERKVRVEIQRAERRFFLTVPLPGE